MRNYPTIQDIWEAQERLKPHIRYTPLLRAEKIEKAVGCQLYLKPETLQITGAFKIRGALNKALSLSREEIANGIIASSSGNHAQGVAYAARMLGVKVILVLPVTTPKIKIDNTKALGAEVILFDGDNAARWRKVYEIAEEHNYAVIHGFEDPLVMAGQGTIGCEILEDLEDVDTVIVPLGGGGLIIGNRYRDQRNQTVGARYRGRACLDAEVLLQPDKQGTHIASVKEHHRGWFKDKCSGTKSISYYRKVCG